MDRKTYFEIRENLYKATGLIGTENELRPTLSLKYMYQDLTDALDEFEFYGTRLNYLDNNYNEIPEVTKEIEEPKQSSDPSNVGCNCK